MTDLLILSALGPPLVVVVGVLGYLLGKRLTLHAMKLALDDEVRLARAHRSEQCLGLLRARRVIVEIAKHL